MVLKEYDLNVFYEDLGDELSDAYTIQPSVYKVDEFDQVTRQYMTSFKLSLEETRAIAPDFPDHEYGSDFFITLEQFLKQAKALPESVNSMIDMLPPVEQVPFQDKEYDWINTLF